MIPHSEALLRRAAPLVLAIVLALLVAACSGGSISSPTTTASSPETSQPPPDSTPPDTTEVADATATTIADAPDITVDPGLDGAVATALSDELEELIAVTEEVRGLSFIRPPIISIVSNEEMAARIVADLEEDYDPDDVRVLELLGLVPPGTDLLQVYQDLLAEQVLGFYDPDTGELVVGGDTSDLTPLDRMTVVHELIHSLTDQHFAFGEQMDQLFDDGFYDQFSALQALIEGDATYFQLVYMQEELTFQEQLDVANEVLEADTTALDATPEFIQADLSFPYDDGFRFVSALVERGGIDAVNQAYEDRPLTTEQVLHPSRFAVGEPERVIELGEVTLPGWEVQDEGELGEWGLLLLWVELIEPGLRTQAGDGWGGDDSLVLIDEDDTAFVYAYRADREADAIEVAQAFLRMAEQQMGLGGGSDVAGGVVFDPGTGSGYAFVDRIGSDLYFIAATDPAAGEALRNIVVPSEAG